MNFRLHLGISLCEARRGTRAGLTSAVLIVAASLPAPLVAQPGGVATSDVFRRFSDRVVKIQVVETSSAAKAGIGSAFFVSADGHVVTNYHVIASLVHTPERYRAELVDVTGASHPVHVLGVDVVHDLAILGAAIRPRSHFTLGAAAVQQGDRLYSLGHPEDLGLSIVEGTFNGLLPHTLHPRIHFTGSINSGMSGGPTITEDGRVIGINVATAGNQLSFLVPSERAAELLGQVVAPEKGPPARTLAQVGKMLRDYQDAYLRDMFAGKAKTVAMGPYRLITEPAAFFRCWADATRLAELPYETAHHRCGTDDFLYIAGDHSSGVVTIDHQLIKSRTLNAARFYSLYTRTFANDNTPSGDEEHVTAWRCSARNVRQADTRMRAVLCLRRYRKFDALYDGVLKVAVLGRRDAGLVSTLTVSGATFENIDRLSRRYLEHISWR